MQRGDGVPETAVCCQDLGNSPCSMAFTLETEDKQANSYQTWSRPFAMSVVKKMKQRR